MKSQGHIALVDYLRGIASVMVAWFHLTNTYGGGWVGGSGSYGWLGVEIFFTISGFVITLALCRNADSTSPRSFGTFMIRRLIRLEPPYIASLILTVGLLYLSVSVPGFRGAQPDVSATQIAFHFAYLIPFTDHLWLQPVYWTLTYEFFFYIVAGLVVPYTLRKGGEVLLIGIVAIAGILVCAGIASSLVMLFALGIAACRAYLGRGSRLGAAIVAIFSAGAMTYAGHGLEAGVGLVTAALMSFAAWIPALPASLARILRFFGAISYSLYLIHVPIGGRMINLGRRFVDGELAHLALSSAAFVLSCLVAVALWHLVERPALRAASRWGRPIDAPDAPSSLPKQPVPGT